MSKQVIVTTTIHAPTKAILKFCKKKAWTFLIVGDKKTPHDEYVKLEKKFQNIHYISPLEQEKKYKKLSDAIGWNSIQRRNIGFIEAYKLDAEIIATVDDDNIPYPTWGEKVYVGKKIFVDCYKTKQVVFDPLSITKANYLWHRGFPIDLLGKRLEVFHSGKIKRKVLVQADLWEGDPDIDAIARLTFHPEVTYKEIKKPFSSNKISPFNSQNTFLSREVLPYYAVIPHIGRMDDIWGAYIVQHFFPHSVIYAPASVYQKRNKQDLITNLEKEIIGYRNTLSLIKNLNSFEKVLPPDAGAFYSLYRKEFK